MSRSASDRAPRWRRLLLVAGMLVGAALIALVIAVPSLISVYRQMTSGRDNLEQGRSLLLSGQTEDAARSFAAASSDFRGALGSAKNPVLGIAGLLPLVGRTPDTIRDLAEIGSDLADAGVAVTQGIEDLPQGLTSLAPTGGRIPLGAIGKLSPSVAEAQASLEQAQAISERLPDSWLPGPVSAAVASTRGKLDKALPLARSAASLLATLPDFAGANGAKRYLVAAANPAELRGTAGFIGEWSILSIQDGDLSLAPFQDVGALKNLSASRAPAPNEEMAYLYGDRVAGFWTATNSMPDAPTAATLAEHLWDATHKTRLDGVIYVTPQALSLMLAASGPVESPSLGVTLTSDNVVPFVTNKAYFIYGSDQSAERKTALGVAAGDVWNSFLALAPPKQALDALASAASAGYIVMHSTDPAVQAAFEAAGIAGRWRDEGGDFFGTSINNIAGNKVDFYMRRQLVYGVALGPNGSAEATAQVILSNDAPAGAAPGYALGPYAPRVGAMKLKPGRNYSVLSTYCAAECRLVQKTPNPTIDGEPLAAGMATGGGLTIFVSSPTVDAQKTRTLDYDLALQNVWEGTSAGGTYRLHLQGQPTIKPTAASVSIAVPDGMEVVSASEGTQIAGHTVTWAGEVGKGVDIEIAFQPPLLSRTWTQIKDFLNKPVIKF